MNMMKGLDQEPWGVNLLEMSTVWLILFMNCISIFNLVFDL